MYFVSNPVSMGFFLRLPKREVLSELQIECLGVECKGVDQGFQSIEKELVRRVVRHRAHSRASEAFSVRLSE